MNEPINTPDPGRPINVGSGGRARTDQPAELVERVKAAVLVEMYPTHDPGECSDDWQADHAEKVTRAALSAAGVPGLVAEVERLRDVAHTLANEAEQREDEGRAAEQERDEFERRYSTVLRNLNAAQQELADLRAGIEALAEDYSADYIDPDDGSVPVQRLRALLAGSGEQPGCAEHAEDARPAPVVPDSPDAREATFRITLPAHLFDDERVSAIFEDAIERIEALEPDRTWDAFLSASMAGGDSLAPDSPDALRERVKRAVAGAVEEAYTFEGGLDPAVDDVVTDAVLAVVRPTVTAAGPMCPVTGVYGCACVAHPDGQEQADG